MVPGRVSLILCIFLLSVWAVSSSITGTNAGFYSSKSRETFVTRQDTFLVQSRFITYIRISVSDPYIPMYYYVTKENVEHEKADPGSQPRSPGPECDDVSDPPLFLWNQALYVIAQLLTSNLLHINELDPIRRYLPSYNRPKRPGRYSAFQVKKY